MANYANLLATIAANIYTNNNNEVTAAMVKSAVDQMVASLGAGYQFMGVATPATTPGSTDIKQFYIASEPGTYTNFLDSGSDPLEVNDGEVAVLKYDTAWSKELTGAATKAAVDEMVRNNDEDDFAIADAQGYRIVRFRDGQVATKKFDSAATPSIDSTYIEDFSLRDENNNAIALFKDGHIQTKNFNSASLPAANLAGKRVSILGDSISTFSGYMYSPNAAVAYPKVWMNDVLKTYWMQAIAAFGAELGVNDSWAGTMVSNTQPTDSGSYGPNRCLSSQTRIDHLGANGDPDVIIVYGGTNDIGQEVTIGTFNTENPIDYTDAQIAALPVAEFADAYRAMMIRLQKTYPSARIVAILPNYINSSLDHYISDVLDEYIEMERTICDYFGVKYLDCRTCGITLFNRDDYLGDGIHPNVAGMNLIAKQLINLLNSI